MQDLTSQYFKKALSDPDVKQQYANHGLPPQVSESPEQFAAFMRADYDRIARLVKNTGEDRCPSQSWVPAFAGTTIAATPTGITPAKAAQGSMRR